MATAKMVWGIDVGQCALKALKLRSVDGQLQVEAFDVIEHPKMLRQGDADQAQLTQNALEQFLARNNVAGCQVAIAVPGRSSFTRFVKLPPVEPKKIPDIVRFEAEQQIPFPIDEVTWRWQAFHDPDSPDVEVGLFAMKRVDIDSALEHFAAVELEVDVVQMAPLALYNFMVRDKQVSPQGATLLADVGTDKTDLVVADGSRIWTRTIQVGGRNFTEALEKAFKLSSHKAEKLKRTAATNKYARQVFQAMRPVFADLVQEIQRSIGYYTSLHRETRFTQVIGLGNGFRLPGLQKFLEQNLGVPVTRVDSYNCLTPSATINAPVFTENVLSFGVAYGLALQGLGEAPVSTNLLPEQISRRRLWASKRGWFAGAAAAVVMIIVAALYRGLVDRSAYGDQTRLSQASRIESEISGQKKEYGKYNVDSTQERAKTQWYVDVFKYRSFWPSVQEIVSDSIRGVAVDQQYMADAKALGKIPRSQRRIIIVESLASEYVANLATLTAGRFGGGGVPESLPREAPRAGSKRKKRGRPTATVAPKVRRGFKVRLEARTQFADHQNIITSLLAESDRLAEEKGIKLAGYPTFGLLTGAAVRRPGVTRGRSGGAIRRMGPEHPAGPAGPDSPFGPSMAGPARRPGRVARAAEDVKAGPVNPDPLIPTEDMSEDKRFWVEWVIVIDNEETTPAPAPAGSGRSR